jgi:hypothetical protein
MSVYVGRCRLRRIIPTRARVWKRYGRPYITLHRALEDWPLNPTEPIRVGVQNRRHKLVSD